MSDARQSRLQWVDIAKAIGIVLVVYGHVARGLQAAGIGFPEHVFHTIDSSIYSFHMPLFFFLSGIFLDASMKKLGARGVFESKIDSILYPYVIWSLIQGGIEIASGAYKNTSTSASDIFSLTWNPRAQFWFLYVLMIAFMAACIIKPTYSSRRSAVFGAASIYYYFLPETGIYVMDLAGENLVFFYIGTILPKSNASEQIKAPLFAIISTGAAILLHTLNQLPNQEFMQTKASQLLLAVASIFCVASISYQWSKRSPHVAEYIGKNSMPIYLMHIIFASGFRTISHKFLGIADPIFHVVAGTIVGVTAPLWVNFVLKKHDLQVLYSAPISSTITSLALRLRQKMH